MSQNNNNHSNQCNSNNRNYQGYSGSYQGSGTQSSMNNHSNQMNPKWILTIVHISLLEEEGENQAEEEVKAAAESDKNQHQYSKRLYKKNISIFIDLR